MSNDNRETAFNRPQPCSKCAGTMNVTRRARHPVVIQGEKQVLTCLSCGTENTRSMDSEGAVIA